MGRLGLGCVRRRARHERRDRWDQQLSMHQKSCTEVRVRNGITYCPCNQPMSRPLPNQRAALQMGCTPLCRVQASPLKPILRAKLAAHKQVDVECPQCTRCTAQRT